MTRNVSSERVSAWLSRFEDNYTPEPNSGCFLWLGAVSSARNEKTGRYARTKFGGRVHNVSRLLMSITHGPIPSNVQVRHKCDNPYCVNPDHLVLGSSSDNMRDMYRRKRHPVANFPGARNGAAKLDVQTVRRIRYGDHSRTRVTLTAARLGVSPGTISNIRQGKAWRNV